MIGSNHHPTTWRNTMFLPLGSLLLNYCRAGSFIHIQIVGLDPNYHIGALAITTILGTFKSAICWSADCTLTIILSICWQKCSRQILFSVLIFIEPSVCWENSWFRKVTPNIPSTTIHLGTPRNAWVLTSASRIVKSTANWTPHSMTPNSATPIPSKGLRNIITIQSSNTNGTCCSFLQVFLNQGNVPSRNFLKRLLW